MFCGAKVGMVERRETRAKMKRRLRAREVGGGRGRTVLRLEEARMER
jgi:hypothetical protein